MHQAITPISAETSSLGAILLTELLVSSGCPFCSNFSKQILSRPTELYYRYILFMVEIMIMPKIYAVMNLSGYCESCVSINNIYFRLELLILLL